MDDNNNIDFGDFERTKRASSDFAKSLKDKPVGTVIACVVFIAIVFVIVSLLR